MIARKNTESSLEEENILNCERRYSVDSEEFKQKKHIKFFRTMYHSKEEKESTILNSDSDDEYIEDNKDKEQELLHY